MCYNQLYYTRRKYENSRRYDRTWAETSSGLGIIIEPFFTDGTLDTAVVLSLKPKVEILQRIAAYVIPRPDLPRAWRPDGTPSAGQWEYRPEILEAWGEWKLITSPTTDEVEAESWTNVKQFKNAETRVMKRYVNQWEEA